MKKKRLLIAGIIILIIITIFLINHFRSKNDNNALNLSGNVEVTETNIGFKLPGRVIELAVDEGQQVRSGQLIARLDNAELASVVMQHKATLQEAMARLAELKSGSRIQEIERARASVDAQAADLDKAKKIMKELIFCTRTAPFQLLSSKLPKTLTTQEQRSTEVHRRL